MRGEHPQLRGRIALTQWQWPDAAVLMILFVVLYGLLRLMAQDGQELASRWTSVEWSVWRLPVYALQTVLRMWAAFVCSLLFTVCVGSFAAKNRRMRGSVLLLLDVFQAIPVLGFLSVAVGLFLRGFEWVGMERVGAECVAIFAIFTGQVWNMTFGFYHSISAIPAEWSEVASLSKLNRWQRFWLLEGPASLQSLIWNSMMSFGGGWFFVTQSEAISVMNRDLRLPGVGSFLASALERGDRGDALWAVCTMVAVIVVTDQLVWRPLQVWSGRFKTNGASGREPPISWVIESAKRSVLLLKGYRLACHFGGHVIHASATLAEAIGRTSLWGSARLWQRGIGRGFFAIVFGMGIFIALQALIQSSAIYRSADFRTDDLLRLIGLGLLTMARVLATVFISSLVWVPIGVAIGLRPRLAKWVEPAAQVAASLPVNTTFPWAIVLLSTYHISMNWGSVLLMAMGTQWYVLFNVIAGAGAISGDWKEAAQMCRLRGWQLWKTVYLPAVFPFWVTGACSAAGGAWNASVVSELASWGDTTLKAQGLGAVIAEVTRDGRLGLIFASIATMAMMVVGLNRIIWRPLYALAEKRFHAA